MVASCWPHCVAQDHISHTVWPVSCCDSCIVTRMLCKFVEQASSLPSLSSRFEFGLSFVEMPDTRVRETSSGSLSPRPLQSVPVRLPAPPRPSASGYWPWPPRYMMDPRMFMFAGQSPVSGL